MPLDHASASARQEAAWFRASTMEQRASDAQMRIRMTTLKHRIRAQRVRLAGRLVLPPHGLEESAPDDGAQSDRA
ncbi:MAG TPA: hypothetical protein VLK53_13765 [Gaiellaceae bacterium]|nr:hypothetical protein [Gaiellaceae bacterium]